MSATNSETKISKNKSSLSIKSQNNGSKKSKSHSSRNSKESVYSTKSEKINYQDEIELSFYGEMLKSITEYHESSDKSFYYDGKNPVIAEYGTLTTNSKERTKQFGESDALMTEAERTKAYLSKMSREHRTSSSLQPLKSHSGSIIDFSGSPADNELLKFIASNFSFTRSLKYDLSKKLSKASHDDWRVKEEYAVVRIKFINGNTYEGEMYKNMMHGIGIFRWSDGTIYEGHFTYGYITGNGILTMKNLSRYAGKFCRGKFHGRGTLNVTLTSMIYCGDWKQGKKHGNGWFLYSPQNWYEGEWLEDNRHGLGLRQYSPTSRYNGYWLNGHRHGTGVMLWENNDCYKGEWENGIMHGEGTYIWRTFPNQSLVFPVQNFYKGTWKNGMRNGSGVMFFGVKNGCRYIGEWQDNQKHGGGKMIYRNGKMVVLDKIFENDKPVHLDIINTSSETLPTLLRAKEKHRTTLSQVPATAVKRQSSLLQTVLEDNAPRMLCNPLVMPIYSDTMDIQLNFYIKKIMEKFAILLIPCEFEFASYLDDNYTVRSSGKFHVNVSHCNMLSNSSEELKSLLAHNKAEIPTDDSVNQEACRFLMFQNNEKKRIRNFIITHLKILMDLYEQYATIASDNDINSKTDIVMVRLFLWQFYIDIDITKHGISLVKTDILLAENSESIIESKHDPFEPIYFWQFIQSLLGTCIYLYMGQEIIKDIPQNGILRYFFGNFLNKIVLPNKLKRKGLCLFKYRNIAPIQDVYSLYLTQGNPPTARDFLMSTCRRGALPACVLENLSQKKSEIVNGINTSIIGNEIIFLPETLKIDQIPFKPEVPPNEDPFYKNLKAFHVLGPKVVLRCIFQVCPMIKTENLIVDINYPITFIEFYEILLLCTLAVIEQRDNAQMKLKKFEENLVPPDTPDVNVPNKRKEKLSKKKK